MPTPIPEEESFTPYTPNGDSSTAPPLFPTETEEGFVNDDPLWTDDDLDSDSFDGDG